MTIRKLFCLGEGEGRRSSCFFSPSPLPWRYNKTIFTHSQNLLSVSPNVTVHVVNHTCNEFNQTRDLLHRAAELHPTLTCFSSSELSTCSTRWCTVRCLHWWTSESTSYSKRRCLTGRFVSSLSDSPANLNGKHFFFSFLITSSCLQSSCWPFVYLIISFTQQCLTLKFMNLPRCGLRGNYICQRMSCVLVLYLNRAQLLNLSLCASVFKHG